MSDDQAKAEGKQVAAAKPREAWENFKVEVDLRADEIASQLPSNVSKDRFINASIAAVKQTPAILTATPRSLFAALTKAAQDGLLPDGREGVITVYNGSASWNPMTFGLRKRARELDGIIIDTQIVYTNDMFERDQGDDPRIIHKPAPLGQDSGAPLGAYAIFKHPTEGILHREVMSKAEIETTRAQSKAKDSLMWTKFWTEAWRKTVARRGIKSVPVSPALERLVTRDDDNFEFDRQTPQQRLEPPEVPQDIPDEEASHGQDDGQETATENLLAEIEVKLQLATDEDDAIKIWDGMEIERKLTDDPDALARAWTIRKDRVLAFQGDMFPGDRPR